MKSVSIFGFALSFTIISLMIKKVGLWKIAEVSSTIDITYFALAISLYVINSFIHTYRWKMLANDMKIKAKSAYFFIITWIGFAINSITPVAISGGEPAKVYYLSKVSGAKKSKTLATVIATDFLEIGSFIALDIFAVAIIYYTLNLPSGVIIPLLMTILLGTGLVGTMIYMSLSRNASAKFMFMFTRFLKKFRVLEKRISAFEDRIEHHIEIYNTALKEVSRKTIIATIGMSAIIRISDVLRIYITILALGADINPVFVIVANAFATAASAVPLLPGSIGVLEPAMVAGLMLGGVSLPVATAAVMLNRIAVLALDAIVGFPGIQHMGKVAGGVYIEGIEGVE